MRVSRHSCSSLVVALVFLKMVHDLGWKLLVILTLFHFELVSGYIWFGFTTRLSFEVLKKIHEKLHAFCSSYGLTYIDNRNIRGVHLCQHNLHLLQSGKKILFNNFFSYLNSNFLMYPHLSQTST